MDKNIKEILRLNKNYHIYEQANELDILEQELKVALKELKVALKELKVALKGMKKSLEKDFGSEIEKHNNYLKSLSCKATFVDEDNEEEVSKALLSYIGR
jgi:hypothetical protein